MKPPTQPHRKALGAQSLRGLSSSGSAPLPATVPHSCRAEPKLASIAPIPIFLDYFIPDDPEKCTTILFPLEVRKLSHREFR